MRQTGCLVVNMSEWVQHIERHGIVRMAVWIKQCGLHADQSAVLGAAAKIERLLSGSEPSYMYMVPSLHLCIIITIHNSSKLARWLVLTLDCDMFCEILFSLMTTCIMCQHSRMPHGHVNAGCWKILRDLAQTDWNKPQWSFACHVMPCYDTVCHAVTCYDMLCHAVQRRAAPCSPASGACSSYGCAVLVQTSSDPGDAYQPASTHAHAAVRPQ